MTVSLLPSAGHPAPAQDACRHAPAGGSCLDAFTGEILDAAHEDLRALRGRRLLVTGGTGFVGRWLLSTLRRADTHLDLRLQVAVLTRDPARVPAALRGWPALRVLTGDVRRMPDPGAIDAVVHAAACSHAAPGTPDADPVARLTTVVDGTRKVLSMVPGARVLLLSSGAVYGRPPYPAAEDTRHAPDPMDPASGYAEAKRLAETTAALAAATGHCEAVVARLFAFCGPYLPLDAHFVAGNVVADALAGRPVTLSGDGSTVRSWMWPGDLVTWLLAVLVRGTSGQAYNIGSDEARTTAELAELAAGLADRPQPVRVAGRPGTSVPDVYLPDLTRVRRELSVPAGIGLAQSLERTVTWHRQHAGCLATGPVIPAGSRTSAGPAPTAVPEPPATRPGGTL